MNNEVINQVLARLLRRQQQVYVIQQNELTQCLDSRIWLDYSQLQIKITDMDFFTQFIQQNNQNSVVATIKTAWEYGVEVTIFIDKAWLSLLPIKELAPLPLIFTESSGAPIFLYDKPILSYTDVQSYQQGWLIVGNKTIVTPLAHDALNDNKLQLVRTK